MQKALPIGQYASVPLSAVALDFSSPNVNGISKNTSFGCSAALPSIGSFLIIASHVLGARNRIISPLASPEPSTTNVTGIREMLSVVELRLS